MLHQKIKNIFSSPIFAALTQEALAKNPWFTRSSIETAREAILAALKGPEPEITPNEQSIGVICAGNIPLVGFWDMYSALVGGSRVFLKPSQRDTLMRAFGGLVEIVQEVPTGVNTILAMGSDQTMEFLKEKYKGSRLILRGTQYSFAWLDGKETEEDFALLSDDILLHAGLGCRSVVHLFLPLGDDAERLNFKEPQIEDLPKAWYENVRYERARRAMMGEKFIDKDLLLLIYTPFGTPTLPGVVGYSFYDPKDILDINWDIVKCYVANKPITGQSEKFVPFGTAQRPTKDQVFENI